MKTILLIGLGRYGKHIARTLNELGHEVMAIDTKEDRVDAVMPFVTSGQIGDSTDEDFMRSLGVHHFDVCIVAIGDDFQSSLETTALLKDLGGKFVVARAARDRHAKFLLRNGADEVVYLEKQLAKWTAIKYSSDHIFDYIELNKDYSIMEVDIPKRWLNKSIIDLDIRKKYGINIIAAKHDHKLNMEIGPNYILQENDTLLVVGKSTEIYRCFDI
ncbi:MAG: TrkA family potassium uptake protein [Eubacteriales bacterium]|nr:TrkA family potassium uptake protein [Eubacteriales bacterium]